MPTPFNILFTDLDGTLLDEATYSFEPARPAIRTLKDLGIPIILCTSKTFLETVELQKAIGISDPFVVENGGAIYFQPDQIDATGQKTTRCGAWQRLSLGVPYRDLVARLVAIQQQTGIAIRSFSCMNIGEIATDCGLALEEADRAKQREFDEPFRLDEDNPEHLAQIASLVRGTGLTLSTGGRYHHLSGGSEKGNAVRLLCNLLEKTRGPLRTVGIGDSPNDLSMLEAVDLPVVVMRPDGTHHPRLVEGLPNALRAFGVGPGGWNAAILGLLLGEVNYGT